MTRKITLLLITIIGMITIDATAQNASRLIATHTNRFFTSWVPYDSSVIVYLNTNRGGDLWDLSNNRLAYDSINYVGWDGSNYIPYQRKFQTLNNQSKVMDRTTQQISGTTATNQKKVIYTRDGNGNILEELDQDWVSGAWQNTNHRVQTFDGNNNLLSQKDEFWNVGNSAWENPYIWVYNYDGNNNMIRNVSAHWNTGTSQYDSSYLNVFYYNTANKVDSNINYSWNSGWQLNYRSTSTYDMNYNSLGYLNEFWVNNAWENNSRGFTLYDGNNFTRGDSAQQWISYLNAWRNMYVYTNTYDSDTNSVALLNVRWDTANTVFVNDYVDSFAYNNYHQATWTKRQYWDATNNIWVGNSNATENHYYYEMYTAGIKNVEQKAGDLRLFPVPARSNINISMNWNKQQDFTVAIYDVQGRLVKQWGEKAAKQYNTSVPLHGMAPGNYILKIRGKEADVQQQFVVMP